MSFLTRIKAWGIQAADAITAVTEPWEPFTRPRLMKTNRSLADREAECFEDSKLFWRFDKIICHRIPLPMGQPLDLGDQCIWQGIYTGILAMRFAMNPTDEMREMVEKALEGVRGHQNFVVYKLGEKAPRLIRGYDEISGAWEDDASNDSLTGHLAGIYFAYRYGPASIRMRCVELMQQLTARLIADDFKLVKADGTRTKHGNLICGALTDPLQFSLVFAIFTFAERFNFDPRIPEVRHDLWAKYGAMLPYPKVALGTKENWNDEHRAAIHLAIIALEDKSPRVQSRVQAGLRRLWKLCDKRANIWVNALIALGMGQNLPAEWKTEMTRQAEIVLSEFELEDKRYDTEVINSNKTLVACDGPCWQPPVIEVRGKIRAKQPLPIWAYGVQDFIWQRHRFTCDDRIGQTQPSSMHNGLDFLGAYWLSRLSGLLPNP